MGIWHHSIIDHAKRCIVNQDISFTFLKTINIGKSEKSAILLTPYTSCVLHSTFLQSQKNIVLVIDGTVSNFKDSSSIMDEVTDLYLTYGSTGLYRLKGSFSLVLYDKEKKTSILYRSFLMGYPLYYVARNNLLSVSTNPVYLLHRSDVSDNLDERDISSIFSLSFSQWNNTVFSDVTEIKHGEMVIVTDAKIEHKKRKLDQLLLAQEYGTETESVEKYRYLLEKAVEKSLLNESKHGIMLSSGMDSSSLAVIASQILHKKNCELKAYSWTLPKDILGDESAKIMELCKNLDIPLKLFNGEKYGPFDSIDTPLLLPDSPYTNPFWSITEKVYQYASDDGIGGLLNGNYADVTFGSNRNLLVDIFRDRRFELLVPIIRSIIIESGYSNVLNHPSIRGLLRYLLPSYQLKNQQYHAPKWLSHDAKEYQKQLFYEKHKSIKEEGLQHFDTALSSSQVGSLGMDRYLSGAYGIKRIEPHRDLELLNYTLNFPTYMTYRHGQTKYFAREAMRGLLPESIRVQPRVGDLNPFVQNSYARNKKKVREMLLDERSIWKQYVDDTWMENILNSSDILTYADYLVIWISINMQQWTKAIKPGGSLYEGTFMKRGVNE